MSKPFRLAITGTRGHIGYVLDRLPHLPQVELVAAARGEDDIGAVDAWCATHGKVIERFGDHAAMLDAVAPDAVVVCGPFHLHARMCIDAIDRGVHVFTEKLAAITEADSDALSAACERRPDVLLTGMMASRYDIGFAHAHAIIQAGEIGDVRLMNVRKSYKLGQRDAFYADRASYGGTIPWVGSHAIDWMLWFAEPRRPLTVFATHSTVGNGNNGSMEATAACVFTFEGGVAATVSIDVLRPASATTHGDDWARIVGTTGTLEVHPAGVTVLGGSDEHVVSSPLAGRFLFDDFVDAARGLRPAVIDTASTLRLTRVCLAARCSADEGRVVEL